MMNLIFRALAAGISAGVFIGILDVLELVSAAEMFFDGPEMLQAGALTLSMVAAAGVLLMLAIAGVLIAKNRILRAAGFASSLPWRLASVTSVLLGPSLFVLLRLTNGPQASRIPGRALIALAAALLAAGGAAVLIEAGPDWLQKSRRRYAGAIVISLFLSMALHRIDTTVLVRLYPLFHSGLTLLALGAAGAGFYLATPLIGRRPFKTALTAGAAAVVIAGGFSLAQVLGTQNIRFVVGQETGAATEIIGLFRTGRPASVSAAPVFGEEPPTGAHAVESTLSRPGADLFLITVDALRYDRLKQLGAKRSVMPNLDAFTETSVLFTRGYTPIPHTSYAITSLLTGKYTRPLFDIPGVPAVHETWPEILRGFRYETSAFFPPAVFFIDKARFQPYYDKGVGFLYKHVDARVDAREKVSLLIDHVRTKKATGRPHFSWIHFFEAHEPYDETCTRFGDRPEDRYDCELSTVDAALKDLFDFIDTASPDAVVIVTSDHGEAFGEHGDKYHGTSLYDEQVRVPIAIRVPGVPPRTVTTPVSLVDLLGTTTRILDIPTPARVRSRDLRPLLTGDTLDLDAFSEAHDDAMVVHDNQKLICNIEKDLCRLYDLASDPLETRSVAEQQPEAVQSLEKRLAEWIAGHAHFELRPVVVDTAESSTHDGRWPDAIQRALAQDVSDVEGLVQVVATSEVPLFRQKAAELLYRTVDEIPKTLPPAGDDTDPIVDGWLTALRATHGDEEAKAHLPSIFEMQPSTSDVARTATLVRLLTGDRRAARDGADLALMTSAPIEERRRALALLTTLPKGAVATERLLPLIDTYQLTLDVVRLFGVQETKPAVGPLVKRLIRERFPERKAVIIEALADIGDWRAVGPVVDQIYQETPPTNILSGLEKLVKTSPYGRRVPSMLGPKDAVFYSDPKNRVFDLRMKDLYKIVVKTTVTGDAKTLIIRCDDAETGRISLDTGTAQAVVDATMCQSDSPAEPTRMTLEMTPDWSEATIDSLIVVGPPPREEQ